MFGKSSTIPQIDKDQLELLKNAQIRIKQKKGLYIHFVVFLIGAIFLIIANVLIGIGEGLTLFGKDWFVIAILLWLFLLIYHVFNVFITHKFMGKAWEEKQLQKLLYKQNERIRQLEEKLEQDVSQKGLQKKKPELTIIAAAANNNAIGKDNKLIWHLRDDLKRFKMLTNGHHIIMGRKTFESFPKPLPNRTHVVITRQNNYKVPSGVIVVNSLEDALDASKMDSQPFVIGGGEIYKQAMFIADKIELTRVHATFEADTFFPEVDENEWNKTKVEFYEKNNENEFPFSFITYTRG